MRLLSAIFIFLTLSSIAQEFPFPQNKSYEYGYSVSAITSGDVQREYNSWKETYYVECGTDEARVEKLEGTVSATVSEGIGYGMLITVYMGDKDAFDRLWNYYKNRRDEFGLMHWKFIDCDLSPNKKYAASDADLDVAMSLMAAIYQWPEETHYVADADTMLSRLKEHIFGTEYSTQRIFMNMGDNSSSKYCVNPSYYSPAYYNVFSAYLRKNYPDKTEDIAFWDKATKDAYYLLLNNQHEHSGLVSAWAKFNGEPSAPSCRYSATGGGTAESYQYDACRTPWRVAMDYLWWGRPEAKQFLSKMANFVNSSNQDQGGWYGGGGINLIKDGYDHNGKAWGTASTAPFVGGFALSGMAVSQEVTDNFMEGFQKINSNNYFNSTLSLLYKLLATGNFWNPFQQTDCEYPEMNNDASICGVDEINIEVQNYNSENSYTWYADEDTLSITSNKISTDSSGYYSVMLEKGSCKTYGTVIVNNIIPAIPILSTEELCSEPNYEFDLGSSFTDDYTYTWKYDDKIIPLASAKVFTANQKGVYEIIVSADGCEDRSQKIYLRSDLPQFEKSLYSTEPGEAVTIKPKSATDVEWFSDAEGTSSLGTDIELEVSPDETTSYFLKDNGSDCAMAQVTVYMSDDCGDTDDDGVSDCDDECPNDPNKTEPGECGCGETEDCNDCSTKDSDNDGTNDCDDECPNDPNKTEPGECGCDEPEDCITNAIDGSNSADAILTIAPTVSNGTFTLFASTNVTIAVYNSNNIQVDDFSMTANEQKNIGGEYSRGTYLIAVQSEDISQSYMIVKE